ncbi:hypothetical protein [Jeongeupia chitinilytica]|uniref:Uncharacterized protein n=1 Tax=Jeongeupia chitinilytica TaxID=1041641 RepID=A0ABQ3H3K8_9NEIS|nr:hypothetical protein [Jeongeupia chitinilytica]GHD68525.1 hypothetical protein GCM10007350_34030 [Jeongeupia chitinilytica]
MKAPKRPELLLVLLLAACVSPPEPKPAPVASAPASRPPVASAPAAVELPDWRGLFDYAVSLRVRPPAELNREITRLAAEPGEVAQIQRAMAYAQLRGSGDLGRAIALLDAQQKQSGAQADALRPLVQWLSAQYTELRRQDADTDKLNQQLKDAQRRANDLNDKLNALKAIEHGLPLKPKAAP